MLNLIHRMQLHRTWPDLLTALGAIAALAFLGYTAEQHQALDHVLLILVASLIAGLGGFTLRELVDFLKRGRD